MLKKQDNNVKADAGSYKDIKTGDLFVELNSSPKGLGCDLYKLLVYRVMDRQRSAHNKSR